MGVAGKNSDNGLVLSGVSEEMIARYAGSAPRYTSYPTAVEFTEKFDGQSWLEALAEEFGRDSNTGVSLYFHIPFCHELCYFCACNKLITKDKDVIEPYLQAVFAELDLYRELLPERLAVQQIHWGGGTPNFLPVDAIKRLHEKTISTFPNLIAGADVSVEVDPRTCTTEQIKAFREVGFNRLSLGVQDFDPHVQELVNRIQPYEITKALCDTARAVGFSGINVDLIYGLPDQSVAGFLQTVEQILTIRPDRIALYGYAHVTWIKKVQKALERAHLPTPGERIAIFTEALKRFSAAGYRHIGMDHLALPEDTLSLALDNGQLNRNFMGYTSHRGARLLGFGVSSISTLPGAFAQNTKDLFQYQNKLSSGELGISRGLTRTKEDRMRGELIEDLLCSGRINIPEFSNKWGIEFFSKFESGLLRLQPLIDDGLVKLDSAELRLTEVGRLFARNAATAFDAYLETHAESSRPVFSQSV